MHSRRQKRSRASQDAAERSRASAARSVLLPGQDQLRRVVSFECSACGRPQRVYLVPGHRLRCVRCLTERPKEQTEAC